MKYEPQDSILKTNCKDCVLANYDGNTQVGCQAHRIEKFADVVEAYDDEKEFYVINNLCNYYRSNKFDTNINKIKLESQISIELFLDCNNITEADKDYFISFYNNGRFYRYTSSSSLIKKDIAYNRFEAEAIKNKYNLNKIKFHLFYSSENEDKVIGKSFQIKQEIQNAYVTVNLNDPNFIHNAIFNTTHLFHIKTNKFKSFDDNIFFKFDNVINQDLKTALVIEYNELLLISNVAYKVIAYQNDSMNYDENIKNVIKDAQDKQLYFKIS